MGTIPRYARSTARPRVSLLFDEKLERQRQLEILRRKQRAAMRRNARRAALGIASMK